MLDKQEFRKQFDQLASKARRIAVVGHVKPDADALGSILGLSAYLRHSYPNVQAKPILESGFIGEFSKFTNTEEVVWTSDLGKELSDYDLIIFSDGHEAHRFSRSEFAWPTNVPLVCIDHHPGDIENVLLSHADTTAIANSQLILELFAEEKDYKGQGWISKDVADALLFGILGDSGTFRYLRARNARVLTIVQKLLEEFDLDIAKLDDIFNTFEKQALQLLALLLQRTVYVDIPEGKSFMYTWTDSEDMEKYSLPMVKMAVESYKFRFLRQVQGYDWGFIVSSDTSNHANVSFRAKAESLNMDYIAGLIGGGGHAPAAAAKIPLQGEQQTIADVVQLVLNTINKNIL